MAQEPAVDPRYDPAFQRGYATGAARPAASAPHVESALQHPARAPQPRQEAAREPAGELIGMPPAAPEAEVDAATHAPVAAPMLERAPWTNPFAIGLTVVGVAMLAVAAWLYNSAFEVLNNYTGSFTQGQYMNAQAAYTLAPNILAIGVGVLAGVLFLCAVWWSRRPRRGHDDD